MVDVSFEPDVSKVSCGGKFETIKMTFCIRISSIYKRTGTRTHNYDRKIRRGTLLSCAYEYRI